MKGAKLQEVFEDLDFIVLIDKHSQRGRFVRHANGQPLAFFQMTEDGAFRHGWVEHSRGDGRTECLDWPTFYHLVTHRTAGATQ